MDSSAFNYAVGRVRALEVSLLTPGDVERLLGAKNIEETYRVFCSLGFSSNQIFPNKPDKFQEVLNSELINTKKLLISIVHPDLAWVLKILWIRYDFHNLKVALKAKILGWTDEEAKKMLLDLGSVSAEEMYNFGKNGVRSKNISDRFIHTASDAGQAYYNNNNNLRALEYAIDQDLYELEIALANKSNNQFLIQFVQTEIDVFNIVTYFRLLHSENNLKFDNFFSTGGALARSSFSDKTEQTIEKLNNTKYSRMIRAYQLYAKTDEDFAAMEREGDDMLVDYMRQTKHTPLGPEPIFAYFWAKKNNMRVLRMIMVGKLVGLPHDKIRTRLRKLYFD